MENTNLPEVFVIVREYVPGTYEHFFQATSNDLPVFLPGSPNARARGNGKTPQLALDNLYEQIKAELPAVVFVRTGEDDVTYQPPTGLDNAAFESILAELPQLRETNKRERFMALIDRILDEGSADQRDRALAFMQGQTDLQNTPLD